MPTPTYQFLSKEDIEIIKSTYLKPRFKKYSAAKVLSRNEGGEDGKGGHQDDSEFEGAAVLVQDYFDMSYRLQFLRLDVPSGSSARFAWDFKLSSESTFLSVTGRVLTFIYSDCVCHLLY